MTSKSGEQINVNNTEEDIEIPIVNKHPEKNVENVTMQIKENGEQWLFNKVQIEYTSFRAVIKPKQNSPVLHVYLRKGKRPTIEKFDYNWTIPDNTSCVWLNKDENEIIDFQSEKKFKYWCKREVYSVFVSDRENLNGTYYLGKALILV